MCELIGWRTTGRTTIPLIWIMLNELVDARLVLGAGCARVNCLLRPEGHVECIQRQRGHQPRTHRPAHHTALAYRASNE